jgi:hypothetical protein
MATDKQIEEYKAKGAQVLVGDHAFKRPSRAEYDRWVDAKVNGTPQSANARQLAQACLVSSWDDFVAAIDLRPSLLLNEVLDALIELAGVGGENSKIEVKKL